MNKVVLIGLECTVDPCWIKLYESWDYTVYSKSGYFFFFS